LLEVEVPLLDPSAQQRVVGELVSLRERIASAEARAADVRADVDALWSAALAQAFGTAATATSSNAARTSRFVVCPGALTEGLVPGPGGRSVAS